MTVDVTTVRRKLNAGVTVSNDDIQAAINVAQALVSKAIGEADVPGSVVDRAVTLVAIEQVNQEQAPNGVLNQQWESGAGEISSVPVRISRDPMKAAEALLAPWISGRFYCA